MRSENLISLTSYLGKLICSSRISKYVENITGKVQTAAARESHASKSVKGDEFLKRKSMLYQKRQKISKKSSQFLFKFWDNSLGGA